MDGHMARKMRVNLARALACLAVGAVAVALLELAWDAWHGHDGAYGFPDGPAGSWEPDGMSLSDLEAFAFDGDDAAVQVSPGMPEGFAAECFDAAALGAVSSSADGHVVGIVSDLDSAELFEGCSAGMAGRGWEKVDGGNPLRCTFMREDPQTSWAFLDVSQVGGSGVAVIILKAA